MGQSTTEANFAIAYNWRTKGCYFVELTTGALERIPNFPIADTAATDPLVGVATFAEDKEAGKAIKALTDKVLPNRKASYRACSSVLHPRLESMKELN